jgi:hypothetical protein
MWVTVEGVGVEVPTVTVTVSVTLYAHATVPTSPPSRAALQGETVTRACRMGQRPILRP